MHSGEETGSGPSAQAAAAFSFRECLLLSLPGLFVGAVLRLGMLAAYPDAFLAGDTRTNYDTAVRFTESGSIAFHPKRLGIYPLFLLALQALPAAPSRVIPVIQHGLGLGAVLLAGWIAGHVGARRRIIVPAATLAAAILPRTLVFEHFVLPESFAVAGATAAVALVFPLRGLAGGRALAAMALGIGTVAVKPQMATFAIGLAGVVAGLAFFRGAMRWLPPACSVLLSGFLLWLMPSADGARMLAGAALPWVQAAGPGAGNVRERLAPHIQEARGYGMNYAWVNRRFLGLFTPSYKRSREAQLPAVLPDDHIKGAAIVRKLGREGMVRGGLAFWGVGLKRLAIGMALPWGAKPGWLEEVARREALNEADDRVLGRLIGPEQEAALAVVKEVRPTMARMHFRGNPPDFSGGGWDGPLNTALEGANALVPAWLGLQAPEPVGLPRLAWSWPVVCAAAGCAWVAAAGRAQALAVVVFPAALACISWLAVGVPTSRYILPCAWLSVWLPFLAADAAFGVLAAARARRAASGKREDGKPHS